MKNYFVFTLVLTLLSCFSLACSPQLSSDPAEEPVAKEGFYQPQEQAAPVVRKTLTLKDPSRLKNLPITVLYPEGEASRPVVIFSHGYQGAGERKRPLAEYWASHGYFVILPTHADSRAFGSPTSETRPASGLAWENRAADIAFIISYLEDEAEELKVLSNVDVGRVAVAGHSLGSYTALLSAGLIVNMPQGQQGVTFTDSRPKAFIALSPQGQGAWTGLRDGSWGSLDRPVLFASGSLDVSGDADRPAAWRLEPYEASPLSDKYQLYIEGADHQDMSGRDVKAGPEAELIYKSIRTTSLAFLDAYIKEIAEAEAYLKVNNLFEETQGVAKLDAK